VEIIDADGIRAANGFTLATAIGDAIPGVLIGSYGGPGQLQTITFRGMDADQGLVQLNGQRYSSFQNGLIDASIFSLSGIDRIELLKGGYSSLYGADASGGVVNIITKQSVVVPEFDAGFSDGSYNHQQSSLNLAYPLGDLGIRAGVARDRGDGNFDFDFTGASGTQTLQRIDDDFVTTTGYLVMDLVASAVSHLSINGRYSDAERGSPVSVSAPTDDNFARLDDKDLFVQANDDWQIEKDLDLNSSASYHRSVERYLDPGAGTEGYPEQDSAFNDVESISSSLRYSEDQGRVVTVGGEVTRAAITSDEVTSVTRWQKGVFVAGEYIVDARDDLPRLAVYPSIRYDNFSDVGGDVSPKIGLNLQLPEVPDVQFHSSYGKNFRVPVFNDLYYIPGGNPKLSPERALSFDAGVSAEKNIGGRWTGDVTYFNIASTDLIEWIPGADGNYSPVNIDRAKSIGLESQIKLHLLNDKLEIGATHTLLHTVKTNSDSANDPTAGKQLIYRPGETFGLLLSANYSDFSFNIHRSFIGARFAAATDDPSDIARSFATTDMNFQANIPVDRHAVNIKFEINNLFNADYEYFQYYPMPLRTYSLGFHVYY
jgi:iron complex outermembrane receptor protein